MGRFGTGGGMSRSPFRNNRNELGLAGSGVRDPNHYEHMTAIDHRDKLIEASVYKEEYIKLKEKYKKEA